MSEPSSGAAGERGVRIAVRSRTTLGARESTLELSAPCPVLGRDVSIEECIECPRGRGLVVGATPRDVSVRCRVESTADDAARGATGLQKDRTDEQRASRTPVSEIMTTHVVCVSADLGLAALEYLLLEKGISGAPVVDGSGRPLGVVSKTDVLLARHQRDGQSAAPGHAPNPPTVGDIMMPIAFCLPANESIAKAAALMAFEGVHRLPVLGVEGQVVGVVSPLDVLRWLAREEGYVLAIRD